MTLIKSLHNLPKNRLLLQNDDTLLTTEHLLERVHTLREQYQFLNGKSVAITDHDAISFIIHLVAFDGFVKRLFILPKTVGSEQETLLCQQASVDYVLKTDVPFRSSDIENSGDIYENETEWVISTSGTTGIPKLIYHSLESITASTIQNIEKGQDYVWGLIYDPTRFAGLQVVMQALLSGSTLVVANSLSFEDQTSLLDDLCVNALSATPSWWRKLLMSSEEQCIKKLKQITLGGEICDERLLSQLSNKYPSARIKHIYASTEAGVGFSVKDGKAGFPESWLNNPENSVNLRISHTGNLLIKPKVKATGKEISERLDDAGFLDTGDRVEVVDGRVLFLGRESGAINIGGNKVQPEEVEQVIRNHDLIKDVTVIGKSSPILGQLVVANILLKDDQSDKEHQKQIKKDIIEMCKAELADYKVPALVKFVDSIIYNSTGKLVRS